jgi:hypothetical protein
MIRPVSHPATGLRFDLAEEQPAGIIAFLEDLRENLPSREHGLICEAAGGSDEDRQVYVYKPGDAYWCRHFPGHAHHGSHRVEPESDAHKRGKDYAFAAVDRAGIPAAPEVSSNNATRSDVVAFGAVVAAAEIQASPRDARVIKARDTRARRAAAITTPALARPLTAGIQPVWMQIHDGDADWLHQVPSVRAAIRYSVWTEHLPKPGTVAAAGVRSIDPEPCRPGSRWDHCPVTGRGYCGGWHPIASARTGLTLDDTFVQAASGQLLPFRYYTGYVYLADPASIALNAELGGDGTWEPGSRAATRKYGFGPCRYWVHTERNERERIFAGSQDGHPADPLAAMNAAARAERERREAARVRQMEPCEACGEQIDRMSLDGRVHVATCRRDLLGRWQQLPTSIIPPPAHGPIRRGACRVPACEEPARLYPAGFLCDKHKPRPYLAKGA